MASLKSFSLTSLLWAFIQAQPSSSFSGIVGCPVFGCNPGGSFSYQLQLPTSAPRVLWESQTPLKALPQALGCVGNDLAIVCPALTNETVGYGSFNMVNGSLTWRDKILSYPPLPLMDIYGDVIGSDGNKLLQYRVDGSVLQPVIELFPPMGNIYSLNLANNGILLLTSMRGVLTTYFTNGVPGGTLTLRYKVKNETGVFISVTSPVIRGHRSYILTAFRSKNDTSQENGLLRLFAIDLNDRFVGKIKVAWYIDLRHDTNVDTKFHIPALDGTAAGLGSVLVYQDLVFVALPSLSLNLPTNESDFWAVKDDETRGFIKYNNKFKITDLSVYDMSPANRRLNSILTLTKHKNNGLMSFLRTKRVKLNFPNEKTVLWGSVKSRGVIYRFDITNGDVVQLTPLFVSTFIHSAVEITSKVMTVRGQGESSDSLMFGIKVLKSTVDFSNLLKYHKCEKAKGDNYLIALKMPGELSPQAELLWIIPVPGDGQVEGQIIGLSMDNIIKYSGIANSNLNDIIVAYSVSQNSSNVFAIF